MSTSPYHEAGKLMNQILLQKKSIKSVAFSNSKLKCSKSAYATVCHTIQKKPCIDLILNHEGGKLRKAIEIDKARNRGLVYVLLYELLFGPYGNIRGGGKLKRSIQKHESSLREFKDKVMKDYCKNEDREATTIDALPKFPRYLRVNYLKTSKEEVVRELDQVLKKYNGTSHRAGSSQIYLDVHVPDLIVLPPDCPLPWHELEMVQQGRVILQDKSSCFSALTMIHGHHNDGIEAGYHGGDFIDACAAPGNKTSHLASLLYHTLQNTTDQKSPKKAGACKIFALDRSSSRYSILKQRLKQLAPNVYDYDSQHDTKTTTKSPSSNHKQHPKCPVEIHPMHQDFLQVDPHDKAYQNVRGILLDPSCSGSGIVNSPDRLADAFDTSPSTTHKKQDHHDARIQSLSNFQLVALKHAMSFPQVDRIVYSTCSVHRQENEDVIATALKEMNETISESGSTHTGKKWKLVPPRILSSWIRRGLPHDNLTSEESKALIRVDGLDGDETNGFFVAYLEREGLGMIHHNTTNSSGNHSTVLPSPKTQSLLQDNGGICKMYHPGAFSKNTLHTIPDKSHTLAPSKSKKSHTSSTHAAKKSSLSPPTPTPTANKEEKDDKDKDKKTLPRKAAKKLQWKQKQTQRKLERLQTQAKASTPMAPATCTK